MNEDIKLANDLIKFIYDSPTSFHAVEQVKVILNTKGFKELHQSDKWEIKNNSKYYVTVNDSAIIAFVTGEGSAEQEGFKIIGAHTDSPSFSIKPDPEIVQNSYLKLNTEVYGGPILNTWLDRPLSLAGRVSLRSGNTMRPKTKLVNINKPLLIVPNLAIHLNPKVNGGIELNKQKDTLPIINLVNEKFESDNYLLKLVANKLNVSPYDILDFDLFLYPYEKGCILGAEEEFISSPRIDDLAMIHAGITALSTTIPTSGINVMACFDHEEIGSTTGQGADSPILDHILERIVMSLNKNKITLASKSREDYFRALANSFFISADMAHAIHPNMPEKHDPTNKPKINGGPVIKINANRKYITDSVSAAVYESICKDNSIPVQKFVNRSDMRGGSTLGPINVSHINLRSVDIGNPMLAMHSIRELAGVKDQMYIYKSFKAFYRL
ncbi:MAG: M18 family aminopeptidase [Firmicutes bacterium]|nr:M18 family aminopeptidase [Bacillota bacterium]